MNCSLSRVLLWELFISGSPAQRAARTTQSDIFSQTERRGRLRQSETGESAVFSLSEPSPALPAVTQFQVDTVQIPN